MLKHVHKLQCNVTEIYNFKKNSIFIFIELLFVLKQSLCFRKENIGKTTKKTFRGSLKLFSTEFQKGIILNTGLIILTKYIVIIVKTGQINNIF